MGMGRMDHIRIRMFITQVVLVLLINVPSISFGLAMGWVSLESGTGGADGAGGEEAALVGAAAVTFLAGALAMPLAARAIAAGRKPAMLATSAAFIMCWSLKLAGGWGVVAGRAAAGLGGTAAWVIPPMLALEMCSGGVRGAACVALVLAHNVGFLIMYLAADYHVPHRTVLLCCLSLSVVHFIAYMFVPESPAYLAAHGNYKEARVSLAWCRGLPADTTSSELDVELKALPEPDLEPVSPFRLAKDMLSDVRRRKAFLIALVAVVGQEMCGVLTMLQFAERVFHLARQGEGEGPQGEGQGQGGRGAASDAVVLGAVQLVASALALYLVEKIGRRPLLACGALCTGLCLLAGAGAVLAGHGGAALLALAAAVFADSAGLQPAPYALLPEMFTYQYRGCASLLVTAASDLANAAEILVFPALVQAAGLAAALAVAGALTLMMAAFAVIAVPETRGRTPEQIYEILCPQLTANPSDVHVDKHDATLTADLTDYNKNTKVNNDDEVDVTISESDKEAVRTEAAGARLSDENDINRDHDRREVLSEDDYSTQEEFSKNNGSQVVKHSGDDNNSYQDGSYGGIKSCVSFEEGATKAPFIEIKPKNRSYLVLNIGNDKSQVKEDSATEKSDSNAKVCSMDNGDATVHKVSDPMCGADTVLTGGSRDTECTNM